MKDDSKLDREMTINIRLRPRKLLKGGIFLIMFVVVFYLGRLTAGPVEETLTGTTSVAAETSLAAAETVTEKAMEKESWLSGMKSAVTGFVTGLLPDFTEKETEAIKDNVSVSTGENVTVTAAAVTEVVTETAPESVTNTTANASQAETTGTTITSYSKVAVALNDVVKEWKGTWGKITKMDYLIKNNEEGTIKPGYFIMLVEGYDNQENMIKKKIPLPLSAQTLKAGGSYSLIINVPNGFAYNQVTAGDLADVRITLNLYDASDKLMGSFNKGFDLRGPDISES